MKIFLLFLTIVIDNLSCSVITTKSKAVTLTDKYEEIKKEHFMIYNDEKHSMKIDEFQKDGYAQKGLNLAILRYNDRFSKTKIFLKFDKILNGTTVKPIEIKIYSFKVQLIETNCEYSSELRQNLMKEKQVQNTIIDSCAATNKIHQCKFDVTVSPWEKYEINRYKFNRLFCN